MDVQLFYRMIQARQSEIEQGALNGTLPDTTYGVGTITDPLTRQPKRVCTHVWIASQDNFEKNSQAGFFMSALPKLAAARIVEGTHRLATPAEILAELERQSQQKELYERQELLINRKTQVTVRPPRD